MVWDAIKSQVCTAAPDPRYEAYLTRNPVGFFDNGKRDDRYWVIGPYEGFRRPYKGLTTLAGDLRVDAKAQESFAGACFGQRKTDLPPTGPQPSGGFRKAIKDAVPHPTNPEFIGQRRDEPNATPRRSDQYAAFADFYEKKTLEAHHIIEKSILGALGLNKGDLRDHCAPCVLAAAELHQQIFTPNVSSLRTSFSSSMSNEQRADSLTEIYTELYAAPQMADVLAIAKMIIDYVRRGQPT